jgi:hypothetical protein
MAEMTLEKKRHDIALKHNIATAGTNLEPIAPGVLVEAWEKAFSSDDPSEGGCPNIKAAK